MVKKILAACGVMVVVFAGLRDSGAQSAWPSAEAILFNGKIIKVDPKFTYGQAIAIGDGKILAVGSNQEIRKLAGSETRQIDLHGKTVIPGLIDAHIHSAGDGPDVDLYGVRTMDELLGAIAARVRESKPGELILTNGGWHEGQLKEQRLPLRRDLDKVAPDNPVVVRRGGQQYILNSAALKKWNITTQTPVPSQGQIPRYEDGELNGELVSQALRLVTLPAPPAKNMEDQIQEQLEMHRKLHSRGLTSIRHPGLPIEQYRVLQEMKRRGLLTMRVNFLLGGRELTGVAELNRALDSWKVQPDEGDAWLRIGGVKLYIDGAYEGAWMTRPYAEPWGKGGTYHGIQLVPSDTFISIVRELGRNGFRVAVHTIGDAAADLVLRAYEAADRDRSIVGRRWVIEHGLVIRPDQISRLKRLGIQMSTQRQLYIAAPSMKKFWGEQRAKSVNSLRTLLDNQVGVAGGTDINGMLLPTIYHYVTRNTISDGVYAADQRITRQEALRLTTINNAYLTFEENIKGSLEPGKLADLVVLSDDIITCPEEKIQDLAVLMTMVNGKIVFEHEDFRR